MNIDATIDIDVNTIQNTNIDIGLDIERNISLSIHHFKIDVHIISYIL